MRADCQSLLYVSLLALVCAAAALAPCGVISMTVSKDNETYNVIYNVSNGAAFPRLLPAWTRDIEEFYIPAINAVFYFGPTSALSISFATGVVETFPKWRSPYVSDHGLGTSMYLIGFDSSKYIIYAGFVGDATDTSTIYASDLTAQKWVPLTQFTPTVGEKGYTLYTSLTADGSAITLLNSSSGQSHGDAYTLSNYNVTTRRWGAALDVDLKYQAASTEIYPRYDDSVVVWMEPPTGKGIVAGAYSIVNGKQVYGNLVVAALCIQRSAYNFHIAHLRLTPLLQSFADPRLIQSH